MSRAADIEAALNSVDWPDFVRDREWKVDVDSTGEEAVWIWVVVSDPTQIEGSASEAWDALRQQIRDRLAAHGIDLWPYIRVRSAAESAEQGKRR